MSNAFPDDTRLQIRVTEEQKRQIRIDAAKQNLTISEYVRRQLLNLCDAEDELTQGSEHRVAA